MFPLYAAQANGGQVYKIGRVGYETGFGDHDGTVVYQGRLLSSAISPLGDSGYCKFRRVVVRIRHNSSFTITVKLYVDGTQTKVYDASSVAQDQTIVFTQAAPTRPSIAGNEAETVLQCDCSAAGTSIEVEILADSDDVAGTFLPEVIEVHYQPLRKARQGSAESS